MINTIQIEKLNDAATSLLNRLNNDGDVIIKRWWAEERNTLAECLIDTKELTAQYLYVIEIVRYGNITLGKYLFGAFSNKEKGVKAAKDYNTFRGGKYPLIHITKLTVNEGCPFEYETETINLN